MSKPTPVHVERPPASHGADPTRSDPIGRDKSERRKINTLHRRVAYLREQVRPGWTTNDYVAEEIGALTWALSRIADAERGEQHG